MGVKGLWRLLMPIGRRISIETLEGKILAIDASIWLTQFLKAMRDPESGSVKPAAHLIGFFRRLCKLRFHGIRPILVFDGATPEIKRREIQQRRHRREKLTLGTDGTTHSDEGIQRMAKRLLVAELKKRKQLQQKTKAIIPSNTTSKKNATTSKNTSTGARNNATGVASAFAPGFNLAEDDKEEGKGTFEKEKTDTSADKGHQPSSGNDDPTTKKSVPTEKVLPPSSIHAIELELDDNDWKEAPDIEAVNDFENAVVDIASSSSDEDNDEKDMHLGPTYNHAHNKRQHGKKNKTSNYKDHGIFFDIGHVSKLPSHDRKGIIEEAKKKQRMQSRREFMPVAANPDAYSQTQLRNFLRSTKLNKHIVKMATKIVGDDEGTIGHRMASDATRRIIFTKNHTQNSNDSNSTRQPSSFNKITRFSQREDSENEDEDEDENEWQDESENNTKSSHGENTGAGVIMMHAGENSDNEDDGGGFLPPSSQDEEDGDSNEGNDGFLPVSNTLEKPIKHEHLTERMKVDVNCSDNGGDGGGFLPASPEPHVDGPGSSQEDGGGTYLSTSPHEESLAPKQSGVEPESVGVIQLDDDSSAEGGFLPQTSSDARRAQELNDEMLAKSIQEAEYEECHDAQNYSAESNENGIASAGPLQSQKVNDYEPDQSSLEKNTESQECINLEDSSDDDSEDDVDWEDGEMETHDSPHLTNTDNDAAIAEALQTEDDIEVTETKGVTSSVDEKNSDSAQNSEDNIDWEDGDGADEQAMNANSASNSGNRPETPETLFVDETFSTKEKATMEDRPVLKATSTIIGNDDEFDDLPKNDFSDQASPNANTAALEHAQATAANLTDWAGRAFRRAIAAHIEETGGSAPSSSSPSKSQVHKSPVNVLEKSPSSSDQEVEEEVEFVSDLPKSNSFAEDESKRAAKRSSDDKRSNQLFETATGELKSNSVQNSKSSSNTTPMDPLEHPSLESLQEQAALYEEERNREERDMDTVTDEMKEEVIQMLRLFGIPYVEAPAEAEAQCAMLEELGLVHGIVTEDSDVFVFGGKTIYKNIFQDQKYVEAYHASDAEKELALGRNEFVALSMLLGGDYTEGVKGVGIVNGMEILQAFDVSTSVKDGLEKFRNWLDGFDPADSLIAQSNNKDVPANEKLFQVKHRTARNRWAAPQHFPAENVLNAYLNPVVDKSEERFSWGTPDLENLLLFCQRNMGWDSQETEGMLLPVIKKVEDGSRQTRIESFFMTYEDNVKFANVKSKRLQEVFRSIQGDGKSSSSQKSSDTQEKDDIEQQEVAREEDSRSKRDIKSTYNEVHGNGPLKKRRV